MAKRILIADDQVATRDGLTKFAKLYGYEAVCVSNGADLLTILTNEKFDLIITDLVMPELNGASAVEIMKLQGRTIPVIALTGLAPADIAQVKDKFTKIYHKPVYASDLFEYVGSLLL